MQVKEPVSFTVLMRMSRVPLLYTNVLEEFETSLPSGEIQWITGSGSPLALHLKQNGKRNSMCIRKTNRETSVTKLQREENKEYKKIQRQYFIYQCCVELCFQL